MSDDAEMVVEHLEQADCLDTVGVVGGNVVATFTDGVNLQGVHAIVEERGWAPVGIHFDENRVHFASIDDLRSPSILPDGGRVVERDTDDDLAFEYVHDPVTPEKFLVRCTDCGEIADFSDRGDAHSRAETHGLNCAPTGVTPVSSKRVATDGGVVEAERTGNRYAPETVDCATCGDVAEQMTWGNSERRIDYRCRRCECGGHLWLDTDGTVSNRVGPVFRAHRSGVQSGVNA